MQITIRFIKRINKMNGPQKKHESSAIIKQNRAMPVKLRLFGPEFYMLNIGMICLA